MVEHNEDRAESTENSGVAEPAAGTDEAAQAAEATDADLTPQPADGDADAHATEAEEDTAEEDESEIAADYLEELLDIADLDGDIDIEVRQNRAYLSVVTEENEDDLELLVGPRGEVLDALQELVRLSVLASTGERSRLILDIAGYRDRRGNELQEMAERAIASVKETGEPQHLKPLSPYERKLVHDVVAEHGLHSESEGEGAKRHIVISARERGGAAE
ncbi:protein jag [Curtobacterium sp. S6]|uniref:Jag family protein n=1 Tax=Curtobacterium sp. S6 TaxID=1479623 RepID=UPI0009E73E4C|nr:R3H domain-containing nucleic acid-binding protein [Curtobacterium sp. S6]